MSEETKVGRDFGFFRSMIGLFKVIAWVLNLVALIVLSTSQFWIYERLQPVHTANFTFGFVAATLSISIFIYMCKLYNIPLVSRLPWKLLEIVYAVICALLYFISMCICGWAANIARGATIYGSLATSAVFAALLFVIFLVFGFITFRSDEIRSKPSRHTTSVNT